MRSRCTFATRLSFAISWSNAMIGPGSSDSSSAASRRLRRSTSFGLRFGQRGLRLRELFNARLERHQAASTGTVSGIGGMVSRRAGLSVRAVAAASCSAVNRDADKILDGGEVGVKHSALAFGNGAE